MFLGKDEYDLTYKWREWHLQAYVIMQCRRLGITAHGDQNGASKTPKGWAQGAATGMLKGWPDLCFVMAGGPMWVELKMGVGKLSAEQVELHKVMANCNCTVHTVFADTPGECWDKVKILVDGSN